MKSETRIKKIKRNDSIFPHTVSNLHEEEWYEILKKKKQQFKGKIMTCVKRKVKHV